MKSWAGHWVRPHSSGKPLALSNKVKTGLDETRTLILGGQILLGFQFNGAFEVRFDSLPPLAKVLDAIALGVMLASVGLLIAPSAFHRIADRGESTGRMQVLTGRCAEAALLPFSIALGLDLAIALARTFGGVAVGLVAGAVFAAIALGSWYGLGEVMKQHQGADERLIPTLTERELIFPLVMFGAWSGDDIRHNALVTIKIWQQRGQLVLDRALAVGLRSKQGLSTTEAQIPQSSRRVIF